MKPELRARIIEFNKVAAERKKKADDLDALVSGLLQAIPERLKNLLPAAVLDIIEKYSKEEKTNE